MGLSILTLLAAKKYVKETVLGGGAIVGKNVTVSSIEPIEGGNEVTFSYTLDSGQKKYSTLQVMNGKKGFSPIITTKTSDNGTDFRIEVQDENGKIITSPNLMPTVPEVDISKFVTDVSISDNILLVTKGDGTVKQIQLPTISVGGNSTAVAVSTIGVNDSNEMEIIYNGEATEEFPTIQTDYSTGELTVTGNGNNNITFNVNNDNELEVTY